MTPADAIPPRVERRPNPADWADDEPMMLRELIAVFYPHGPLTVTSLRGEIAAGRLSASKVRNKLFLTPSQVRALFTTPCPAHQKDPGSPSDRLDRSDSRTPSGSFETDRARSAQDALRNACAVLRERKPSSPSTSEPSGRRRAKRAEVIPIRS